MSKFKRENELEQGVALEEKEIPMIEEKKEEIKEPEEKKAEPSFAPIAREIPRPRFEPMKAAPKQKKLEVPGIVYPEIPEGFGKVILRTGSYVRVIDRYAIKSTIQGKFNVKIGDLMKL